MPVSAPNKSNHAQELLKRMHLTQKCRGAELPTPSMNEPEKSGLECSYRSHHPLQHRKPSAEAESFPAPEDPRPQASLRSGPAPTAAALGRGGTTRRGRRAYPHLPAPQHGPTRQRRPEAKPSRPAPHSTKRPGPAGLTLPPTSFRPAAARAAAVTFAVNLPAVPRWRR